MKTKDWIFVILFLALTLVLSVWSGYMIYIEQSNKIMLNNYLKNGGQVHP